MKIAHLINHDETKELMFHQPTMGKPMVLRSMKDSSTNKIYGKKTTCAEALKEVIFFVSKGWRPVG